MMNAYTLILSGTEESDLFWQETAAELGMKIRVKAVRGYNPITVKGASVEILTLDESEEVKKYIDKANGILWTDTPKMRPFTNRYKEFITGNLDKKTHLFHTIKDAEAIVVVNKLLDMEEQWCIAMARALKVDAYFYNMTFREWSRYKGNKFVLCPNGPVLPKTFAGIGPPNFFFRYLHK